MPRGIQPGHVATDAEARKLDTQCKDAVTRVLEKLKPIHGDRLTVQKKLRQNQIPGGIGACAPDGSIWFYDGRLIAAFEAKKQQNNGNAIERWYKNNYICRTISPTMNYVTFACGDGAVVGGVIHKALAIAHLDGFGKHVKGKNSCFMNPNGFTEDEIMDAMISSITSQLE